MEVNNTNYVLNQQFGFNEDMSTHIVKGTAKEALDGRNPLMKLFHYLFSSTKTENIERASNLLNSNKTLCKSEEDLSSRIDDFYALKAALPANFRKGFNFCLAEESGNIRFKVVVDRSSQLGKKLVSDEPSDDELFRTPEKLETKKVSLFKRLPTSSPSMATALPETTLTSHNNEKPVRMVRITSSEFYKKNCEKKFSNYSKAYSDLRQRTASIMRAYADNEQVRDLVDDRFNELAKSACVDMWGEGSEDQHLQSVTESLEKNYAQKINSELLARTAMIR